MKPLTGFVWGSKGSAAKIGHRVKIKIGPLENLDVDFLPHFFPEPRCTIGHSAPHRDHSETRDSTFVGQYRISARF